MPCPVEKTLRDEEWKWSEATHNGDQEATHGLGTKTKSRQNLMQELERQNEGSGLVGRPRAT